MEDTRKTYKLTNIYLPQSAYYIQRLQRCHIAHSKFTCNIIKKQKINFITKTKYFKIKTIFFFFLNSFQLLRYLVKKGGKCMSISLKFRNKLIKIDLCYIDPELPMSSLIELWTEEMEHRQGLREEPQVQIVTG